jgi:outer membrane protein TolC
VFAPAAPPAVAFDAAASTIDLGVALRLAGVDNPSINLAREQVREALAGQLAAESLLLPSLNAGGNFRLHRGVFQATPGFLRDPDLQSLYVGAGSGAVGSGTVAVPGVRLFADLGEAFYQPLAAGQRVAGRQADAVAVRNAVLLDVATAYLELAGAEARLEVARRAEAEAAEVVRTTAAFAAAGEGTRADANRAAANAEIIRRQIGEAEGAVSAAAARLARLLSLDPAVRLRTPGGPLDPVRLVPADADLDALVAAAVQQRPEVMAGSAAVAEARTRVKREKVRPWLPVVSAGFSAGGMGGGSDRVADRFSPLAPRTDFDVAAVWTVQNLGVGNRARVRRATADLGAAAAGFDATVNRVRREVAEADAASRAAAVQIEAADAALAAAEDGFRLEAERIRQGQGRPIEALDSLRQSLDARLERLRAVVAFDVAQFRQYAALGGDPAAAR